MSGCKDRRFSALNQSIPGTLTAFGDAKGCMECGQAAAPQHSPWIAQDRVDHFLTLHKIGGHRTDSSFMKILLLYRTAYN